MNAPELKPCPFCGVELEHFEDGRRLTHVRHPMNGCAFLSGKDWWKVPRFTDPWNTRADLPHTDAEVLNHPKVKALLEKAEVACQDEITRGDKNGQPVYAAAAKACRDGIRALAAIQEATP